MHVIIIGAGLVGSSLAEHLLHQGHNIALIEKNPVRSEEIGEKLDVLMVNGSGSNPQDLEQAGIENATMVIAATPVDEVNLLSCMIARQYDVPHRIARIRNVDFITGSARLQPEHFGITQVIYPEENTLNAVLNYIETPFAIDAQDFAQRTILLRTYRITADMPIAHRSLIELRNDPLGHALLVVAIIRDEQVTIPRGDTVIKPGDKPLFIFPREARPNVLRLVGIESTTNKKAIVFGNTLTAINIARALQQELDAVVLIDPDLEHGNIAAAKLHGIDVLHGSGDDVDVLKEANIRFADFFVAASEYNDENILSCLLAKSEGAREVIAIVNDDQHTDLFLSIGINHIINPRQLTATGILNAILPGYVSPSLHIQKTDIDVLRLSVNEGARVAHKPLKESWRRVLGVSIVGAVLREGGMIIPTGDTVLLPGDLIIVFTRSAGIRRVRKLFGSQEQSTIKRNA
ncbi:MAG: Trk system potassium transporter TrkA [Bacteroidetes bacterium]|nr:Trk system potassium transporter TrkA [Bacteroidota bacterium]